MAERVGERPKPRFLALGVDPESELGQHLESIAPTVQFLSAFGSPGLGEVRQGDWDAIVLDGVDTGVERHLFVIQFGGTEAEHAWAAGARSWIRQADPSYAVEFAVPDGLPSEVAQLARTDLAPHAIAAGSVPTYTAYAASSSFTKPEIGFEPFVVDGDGHAIAARFQRTPSTTGAQWWLLPDTVRSRTAWLDAALAEWGQVQPELFPVRSDWHTRPAWTTPAEAELRAAQEQAEAEYVAYVERYEASSSDLQSRLENARKAADAAERRLLTAQGSDLVDEVLATLVEFGFDVVDVDAEITTEGDRLEDLRVSDPDLPDWIAIAEVRGYTRGAQANDLLRIGRFVRRFIQDEGREPDVSWYITNHFLGDDPDSRPRPLASNAAEVQTFGEDRGCVIDTRELFKLRMSVRLGEISTGDARRLLRGANTRLDLAREE